MFYVDPVSSEIGHPATEMRKAMSTPQFQARGVARTNVVPLKGEGTGCIDCQSPARAESTQLCRYSVGFKECAEKYRQRPS